MTLRVSSRGRVPGAKFIASPNCDARPDGCVIELLVIHHISLPPGEFGGPGIIQLFTNRLDAKAHPFYASIAGMKVSAHFLVRRNGELLQFVPCAMRAWHAGQSSWRGRARCNDFSVGVELEGTGEAPFTDKQYERLVALTRALRARYPIADIVGHSDVAPGRKSDPGPHFDWARYRGLLKIDHQDSLRYPLKGFATPARKSNASLRVAKTPKRRGKAKKK